MSQHNDGRLRPKTGDKGVAEVVLEQTGEEQSKLKSHHKNSDRVTEMIKEDRSWWHEKPQGDNSHDPVSLFGTAASSRQSMKPNDSKETGDLRHRRSLLKPTSTSSHGLERRNPASYKAPKSIQTQASKSDEETDSLRSTNSADTKSVKRSRSSLGPTASSRSGRTNP